MKTILALCGLILAAMIAWLLIARPYVLHYGDDFQGFEPVKLGQLLDKPAEYVKKDVRIEGVVIRMCPHCACWFVVKDAGGRELRVESGETAEQLPYRPGKAITVEGQLIKFGNGYEFIGRAMEFHR